MCKKKRMLSNKEWLLVKAMKKADPILPPEYNKLCTFKSMIENQNQPEPVLLHHNQMMKKFHISIQALWMNLLP